MASKKPKTIKKVTEIPNASVTIEVEETADELNSASKATENSNTEENSKVVSKSESSEGTSWKKIFMIMLVVVPVGFLAFGGFLYFSKNLNTGFLRKAPEKKLELPKATPTPTEEPVDKEAYEIEVQNGSGIAGEGARVKDLLEEAGFKVGAVGNADNSNYMETIITVSEKVEDGFIEEFTKVLEERGTVGKIEKFAEGEDEEILVVIGSDLKEEIEPTPEE